MKLIVTTLIFVVSLLGAGCSKNEPQFDIRFTGISAESGLQFEHINDARGEFLIPEIMGSGVAVFDFDHDGDLDVFLVQGSSLQPGNLGGDSTRQGHRMFRNNLTESGELGFTDVSDETGVGVVSYGMGAAVADYDGDGWQDIYITSYGQNTLLKNENGQSFRDVTSEAGVSDTSWSTSASFFDMDNDGHLDLYVVNYLQFTNKDNQVCKDSIIARGYCHPLVYPPATDRLYRNNGNGTFSDVTREKEIDRIAAPGLGVVASDLNGDGWTDIYVVNDREANLLWMNRGDGRFDEKGLLAGVAYNVDGQPEAGMGVTAGDFDRDGDADLFVTHYDPETNTLYLNNGSAQFQDTTDTVGLGYVSLGYTGWGTSWIDFDNDGMSDLFVANGAITVQADQLDSEYPYAQANQLFMQTENSRFVEVTEFASAEHGREVSRGAAFGDLDNDGDIDIVIANNNGTARVLRNDQATGNHWLDVKLLNNKSNTDAIGARIKLVVDGMPMQSRHVRSDGSYLSASDTRVHFGLGGSTRVDYLDVIWPDGETQRIDGPKVDALLIVRR